jgi:nitrogen fixation/metabolism regulation signal transduction histidine kinase
VNRSLAPKILILVAAIFIAGIIISHRIAGPMYRLEKSAEAMRNGDLSVNFHIRKTDEMHDIASTLEDVVEALRKDVGAMKELAKKGDTAKINEILSKYKT